MLNQRFGNRDVHIVMRHVIADAVGRPSKSQFAQIARPEDQSLVQVGEAKKMRGPLAGLDVLERDIVDWLRRPRKDGRYRGTSASRTV